MLFYRHFWIAGFSVLAVLENTSSDIVETPIFDTRAENVTVLAGETATLPCQVESLGKKYMVVWMSPKMILISNGDRRLMDDDRMSVERPYDPDWNLHIRKVRYDDRGMYRCTLNTNPVSVKAVHLRVDVAPDINEEWSSSNTVVNEGTTVELHCNASGVPTPNIRWYRKTKYTSATEKEPIGTPGEILFIHNISRYCDGIYECVASNGVAEDESKEIRVDVQFKPEVRLLTKRMGHYLGKETILSCVISASPQAEVFWRKGDKKLVTEYGKYRSDVFHDRPHTLTLNLQIYNLQKEDFGNYTCEASNKLGGDTENMLLYEYPVRRAEVPTSTLPPGKANIRGGSGAGTTTTFPRFNNQITAYNKFNRNGPVEMEWNGANSYFGFPVLLRTLVWTLCIAVYNLSSFT
ncbi:opioid-binding protein/cell adhesion molecule-like isoform X1 [Mizuhopecten yessoensis]|uniref:Protein CEPU-1 n=1 Tax=Mizuhopecten yessoensis TaxID=6573 RepID=A0A210QZH9_MIZYE|nr:opioid-binding protein/cell adhesion molecule-like isoform X1 [Mizuhopecten yessoensis]OWF54122.1 Protein CEPU-1 [Mizuhopecten yessoensis]